MRPLLGRASRHSKLRIETQKRLSKDHVSDEDRVSVLTDVDLETAIETSSNGRRYSELSMNSAEH
jgi:hypothetical protein